MNAPVEADLEGRVIAIAQGRGRLFLENVPGCDVRGLYAEPYADGDALERAWANALDRRIAMSREIDATLLVVAAPDAHSVHPEDLPDGWALRTPTVGDVFAERFGDRVAVVRLRDVLRDAGPAAPVWRRDDSHWSAWGAYVAYRTIMDALPARHRRHVVPADAFELGWRDELGDLSATAPAARPEPTPWIRLHAPRARCVDDRSNGRRDAYKVFEVDDPSLPTCLVFRDSFATDLAPYLVESFRRTVLVASGARGFPELILEERPDVVLIERAERTLPLGVHDWAPTTWREHWPAPGWSDEEAVAAAAEREAWRAVEVGAAEPALVAAGAAFDRSPTPDRRFLLGRAHLLAGDVEGAAAAFEAALEEDPGRFAFLLHLGMARLRQARPADARDLFARACALHPWQTIGYEHLGYASLACGDAASAVTVLERAVRLGPELAGGWIWLAHAQQAQGLVAIACETLRRGLVACPDDAGLLAALDALQTQAEA